MKIRIGYELVYECAQPTPMIMNLNVHHSRAADLIRRDDMQTTPWLPLSTYRDGFGNLCTRLVAPTGRTTITADGLIHDTGLSEAVEFDAAQTPVELLPEDTLVYLLGSRYCDTDNLSQIAWSLFGPAQPGWPRVQAICDFVHQHLNFSYSFARASRTAAQAFEERQGVCRDFAHLAIALCRCVNIPARYCAGYLGDIGVPRDPAPMDFSGWFEAYLNGHWITFDARHNTPRVGRVLMARGRDAADVAISMNFGPTTLVSFKVWTYEWAD